MGKFWLRISFSNTTLMAPSCRRRLSTVRDCGTCSCALDLPWGSCPCPCALLLLFSLARASIEMVSTISLMDTRQRMSSLDTVSSAEVAMPLVDCLCMCTSRPVGDTILCGIRFSARFEDTNTDASCSAQCRLSRTSTSPPSQVVSFISEKTIPQSDTIALVVALVGSSSSSSRGFTTRSTRLSDLFSATCTGRSEASSLIRRSSLSAASTWLNAPALARMDSTKLSMMSTET
mmetsp:Transcript_13941/g.30770  ORF Transcript_13941/g.30770 Transcript_13941/m.30770 type:complete len:233 (-) Transcript_13941:2059-2757(-)